MKKSTLLLTAAAILLVCSLSIGSALSYFTAYSSVNGAQELTVNGTTSTIEETFGSRTKHVVITNTSDEAACYVRAIGFKGTDLTLSYSGSGWSSGAGGYMYYDAVLEAGDATTPLDVTIGNIPADAEEGDQFHVVVVYESTPARYGEDGEPYADWTQVIVLSTDDTEGGQGS